MEATQVPINGQADKNVVVHIHNGILHGHEKNKILPFATTGMDLEGIMLSEISQTETEKCHMISLICGIERTK